MGQARGVDGVQLEEETPACFAPAGRCSSPWLEEYQWIDFATRPYEAGFDELVRALTPPNPIQDLLNQRVLHHKQTGVLIDADTLRVIENAQATLKINEEARELIKKSKQVVEANIEKERQVQAELETARRQRERFLKVIGIASTLLMIVITVALNYLGPARSSLAPNEMLSIELAGDLDRFHAILNSWSKENYFRAGVSLGIDFLTPIVYAIALALLCLWASGRYRKINLHWLARLGIPLAYGMWLAAAFDAVGNFAVISMLVGNQSSAGPQMALWASLARQGLLTLGLLYGMVGWLLPAAGVPQASKA